MVKNKIYPGFASKTDYISNRLKFNALKQIFPIKVFDSLEKYMKDADSKEKNKLQETILSDFHNCLNRYPITFAF